MIGMRAFEFLPARRADAGELRRPLQFPVVRVELRTGGDVARVGIRQVGTVDPREDLPATDVFAKLGVHARDAPAGEGRDRDLPIGVRLDHTGQTKRRGRTTSLDRRKTDPRALDRFARDRHLDVGPGRGMAGVRRRL
jgi:hypothetical protein